MESNYTYKEYMQELNDAIDDSTWMPLSSPKELSSPIFGDTNIVHTIIEEMTYQDKLSQDNDTMEDIKTLNDNDINEMVAEPMLHVPEMCAEMNTTINSYLESEVVICMSSYGIKHLLFKIKNCIFALDDIPRVYVPKRLAVKTRIDTHAQGMSCDLHPIQDSDIYYEANVCPFINDRLRNLYTTINKITTRPIHTPMYRDKIQNHSIVDAIVSAVIVKRTNTRRTRSRTTIRSTTRYIEFIVWDVIP